MSLSIKFPDAQQPKHALELQSRVPPADILDGADVVFTTFDIEGMVLGIHVDESGGVTIKKGDEITGVMSMTEFLDEIDDMIPSVSNFGTHMHMRVRAKKMLNFTLRTFLFDDKTDPVNMIATAIVLFVIYTVRIYTLGAMSSDRDAMFDLFYKKAIVGHPIHTTYPPIFNIPTPIDSVTFLRLIDVLLKKAFREIKHPYIKKIFEATNILFSVSTKLYMLSTLLNSHFHVLPKTFKYVFVSDLCKYMLAVVLKSICHEEELFRLYYYNGLIRTINGKTLSESNVQLTNYVPYEAVNYVPPNRFTDIFTAEDIDPCWEKVLIYFKEGHVVDADLLVKTCMANNRGVFNPFTGADVSLLDKKILRDIKTVIKLYEKTTHRQIYDVNLEDWRSGDVVLHRECQLPNCS